MTIELEGYKTILENSFYLKNGKFGSEVMLLRLYRECSEDRVARYISAKAKRLLKNINLGVQEDLGEIGELLQTLPESALNVIANLDEPLINNLKHFTQTYYAQTEKQAIRYINVKSGLISPELLSRRPVGDNPLFWYNQEIEESCRKSGNRFGWRWELRLKLDGYSIPQRSCIDFLIDDCVVKSKRLTVDGSSSWEEVKSALEMLSKKFVNKEQIKQLTDVSRDRLEFIALDALEGVVRLVQKETEEQLEREDKIRRGIANRYHEDLRNGDKDKKWLFGEN